MICLLVDNGVNIFIDHHDSVGEVEEVVGGIVVLPHAVATDSIGDQEGEPGHPPESAIEVLNPPSLDHVLAEASEHVMEVEVLID